MIKNLRAMQETRIFVAMSEGVSESRSVMSDSLRPHGL